MAHQSRYVALGAALCLLAAPALAQTPKAPKPLPVMRGAVQDTLGQPLEGAQIEILGLNRTLTTPGSGAYRFDDIKPGKYWVAVRRIGYAPLRAALSFNQGDDREIEFQLEPLAHELPEVKVRGEDLAWRRKYQDFIWRSRMGFGHFLTRDDIVRAHASVLGDVVQRYLPYTGSHAFYTPGFTDPFEGSFRQSPFGATHASVFASASNCSPVVSVNGGRPMGGWAVNDFRPDEVEAVEVYRSVRQMPTEFAMWGASCGLVVVWTR